MPVWFRLETSRGSRSAGGISGRGKRPRHLSSKGASGAKGFTMPHVTIYTTMVCPYCIRARNLLRRKGVHFEEIAVDHDQERMTEMQRRSRRYTVPQIFIDDRHIGGYDDMALLDERGELDPLLGLGHE